MPHTGVADAPAEMMVWPEAPAEPFNCRPVDVRPVKFRPDAASVISVAVFPERATVMTFAVALFASFSSVSVVLPADEDVHSLYRLFAEDDAFTIARIGWLFPSTPAYAPVIDVFTAAEPVPWSDETAEAVGVAQVLSPRRKVVVDAVPDSARRPSATVPVDKFDAFSAVTAEPFPESAPENVVAVTVPEPTVYVKFESPAKEPELLY